MENNNNDDKGHDQDIVASTSGTANDQSRRCCFPAGYRFVPTDDELITHYLAKQANNEPLPVADMHEVDLYSHPPNELAGTYTHLGDREWYFFTPRDRKYPKGERPSRSVGKRGYWKATGVKKPILSKEGVLIGRKTCLVFYFGKPKSGKAIKTNWIMHEYELESNPSKSHESGMTMDDCILCKIYERHERLNKKQNDVNGPVADNEDQQKIEDHPAISSVEETIEDPAIALHIPDNNNINAMGQNHEQLSTMMNNNGYGESNGHFQPQIREHVPINGYVDTSHQFQTQNHRHVRMNGYVNNYSHQFPTQNHQHLPKNGYRDHSHHQLQPQNRFGPQVVPNYPSEASSPCIQLYGSTMQPIYDQHYYLHEQQQAPGWVYPQQEDIKNVYWGHNGNDFQQHPDDSRTKRRRVQQGEFQHDYDQGHNEINNVEQDPHNIHSNYVAVDEGLRAKPENGAIERADDVASMQGDLQQGNSIGSNFEQDTAAILSYYLTS